jgi:putative multiple sugar transport system substrate-binding protein
MKKILALVLALALILSLCSFATAEEKVKIGVSMPTKDLQRWNQDGQYMEEKLTEAGYEPVVQYASNDANIQLSQVETMIDEGCKILVIAAEKGDSLGQALAKAAEKGVKVIAYDRLLMSSKYVDFYATFDNEKVGTVQGNYIKDALDLDNAEGPFYMEITGGDSGDNNAPFFYKGAIDVLKPYIDAGKIVVRSGQIEFTDVATPDWKSENAQKRAEDILAANYANGEKLDAWLCSNDSTAYGVINALDNYDGEGWPIVTGQDCDKNNVKLMIEGKQAMSVFKDTRTLADRVVTMIGQILNGEEVEVNDTTTYDNGEIVVPSFLCEPVFGSADNYKELLIDSGYYTLADIGLE